MSEDFQASPTNAQIRKTQDPGQILNEEFMKSLNITQTALAAHLGWTHAKVSEIINGRRGVSPESALSLAEAFGTTPEFWLSAQAACDLWEAKQGRKTTKRLVGKYAGDDAVQMAAENVNTKYFRMMKKLGK